MRQGLRRKVAIVALIFLVAVAAGCSNNQQEEEEAKIPVELASVGRRDIARMARTSGTIQAETTAHVMAAMPGKLEAVLVDVGYKVTAGQIVARLENSQAEAALAQAKAGLEQIRIKAALDAEELQRVQILYEEGAASQQMLDGAQTVLKASQAQEAAALAGVQQAQIAVDNNDIRAPISGQVVARLMEPGALAQGPIITLISGDLQVEIGVSEQDVNYLQPGQQVEITVPAATTEPLSGKVISVSPTADARLLTYTVKIKLAEVLPAIKPGMAASATYSTESSPNALTVPKAAVVNRAGQNVVFSVDENGRAVAQTVTTGIDDGQWIEIIKGLDEGDEIIVKGQDYVSEGQQVEVVGDGGQQS